MKDIELPAVHREGFSIVLERGDPLLLKVTGTADMDMLPVLGPFLRDLHTALCRAQAAEISVDFRDLGFMNSSCFKCFITWIASIAGLDPARRYRTCFFSNPKLHWQRRSLEAMRAFAPALVRVET
jgi:hypothetical protein